MTAFNQNKIDLSNFLVDIKTKYSFESDTVPHQEQQMMIKDVYDKTGRVIDPHTAAGVKAAIHFQSNNQTPPYVWKQLNRQSLKKRLKMQLISTKSITGFEGIEDKEQRF